MKLTSRHVMVLAMLGVALAASGCMSPLIDAASRGDVQTARTLLDQGTKVDDEGVGIRGTALHHAAWKGHIQVMEVLLERGANVNARESDFKETPLHWAVGGPKGNSEGQLKAVQLLVDRGADVNAKNSWGQTPLHRAAKGGHMQIARLLLERGAVAGEAARRGGREQGWIGGLG